MGKKISCNCVCHKWGADCCTNCHAEGKCEQYNAFFRKVAKNETK